jgi:hypothetical protein
MRRKGYAHKLEKEQIKCCGNCPLSDICLCNTRVDLADMNQKWNV